MNSDYLLKAVSLAALVFLLFVFIRYVEKKNLYFPLRTVEATPGSIGLEYEDIWVTTADGVGISGWFIRSASPRAVLIFCHGNGGNIGHRLGTVCGSTSSSSTTVATGRAAEALPRMDYTSMLKRYMISL
jgi:hypothetical protein